MKILYLYSEVMGYTMATIRALAERGIEVHVVHWDHKKLTPYQAPPMNNVYMYKRSELTTGQIKQLAKDISPTITVVSGWMDISYLLIACELRVKGIKVVTCFDDIWFGSCRQKIAALMGYFGLFSLFFSHAWVTGSPQFEYARRLGFNRENIIYDLYSADLPLFHEGYKKALKLKNTSYPHRFIFVGRLEPVKGIHTLLHAWELLGFDKKDWELHLIGDGSLRPHITATSSIKIKQFMQPEKLVSELVHAGCFILPSFNEPWGVVVHEFAAAGLPLIISDAVGASSTFLVSGLNGFYFKAYDSLVLKNRMLQIINMNDNDLRLMANNSYMLSNRITPITSSSNLLSLKE